MVPALPHGTHLPSLAFPLPSTLHRDTLSYLSSIYFFPAYRLSLVTLVPLT